MKNPHNMSKYNINGSEDFKVWKLIRLKMPKQLKISEVKYDYIKIKLVDKPKI